MRTELKPCPFCGSTDLDDSNTYIVCNKCDAYGPSKHHKMNWNIRTRTPQPDAAGLVAALSEFVTFFEKWSDSLTLKERHSLDNARDALCAYRAAAQPKSETGEVEPSKLQVYKNSAERCLSRGDTAGAVSWLILAIVELSPKYLS